VIDGDYTHPGKSCDMLKIRPKNRWLSNLAYLANLCNSTVIEIYGDLIQVSHGFDGCQMLEYIADTCNSAPETGTDDITGFLASSIFPIRWR
jgi:hypothetical protein